MGRTLTLELRTCLKDTSAKKKI